MRSVRSFARGAKTPPRSPWPIRMAVLCVLLFVTAAAVVGFRNIRRRDALMEWRRSLEAEAGRLPWPAWSPAWPPLPQPPARRHRLPQDLHGVYAYAATHQETLSKIPCFCGCAREGHTSVSSCFIQRFRGDGAPVWTAHSFDCEMCVHIAREVMLMESQGRSIRQIRAAIEERYAPGHVSTPTPVAYAPEVTAHEHSK